MRLTLTAAAKEAGVSKGTISKALKSGRMSGERQEDGSFQIEPVELFRVFPRKQEETRSGTVTKPSETRAGISETPGERSLETDAAMAVLRSDLEAVREALHREREDRAQERETAKETVEDLRKRLDAEQAERRALQRQLMPPTSEKLQEAPAAVEELRKRLEEAEARIASFPTQETLRETPTSVPVVAKPPKKPKGLLARFLGRG